jgi:hypothetical protein
LIIDKAEFSIPGESACPKTPSATDAAAASPVPAPPDVKNLAGFMR